MPEYLAPGVFVEELPSADRPIEGVSTSTAGMVGVARRGPTDTPTLVTSFGAFNRVFGGFLDHRGFRDGLDALPYAAQGFFGNGGGRLYVTRIVGDAAASARADIFAAAATGSNAGVLAAQVPAAGGPLRLTGGAGVSSGDAIVIADGERSEVVTASADAAASAIRLTAPIPEAIDDQTAVPNQDVTVGAAVDVENDMIAGGIPAIDASGLAADTILMIADTGDPALTEFVTLRAADAADSAEPGLLFDHAVGTTTINVVTLAAGTARELGTAAAAGDTDLTPDAFDGLEAGTVLDVPVPAGTPRALRVVGAILSDVALASPTVSSHPAGAGASVQTPVLRAHVRYPGLWGNELRISARESSALVTAATNGAGAGETVVVLDQVFGLATGAVLAFATRGGPERHRVVGVDTEASSVELATGLSTAVDPGAAVTQVNLRLIVTRIENGREAEREEFDELSLDPEAPRYAPRIVGSFNRATATASRSGGSQLIRLSDLTRNDADDADVAGAVALRLMQPAGTVTWPFTGGDDDIGGIDDFTFVGTASDDPDLRTGIQAMENELGISLVAVPGRASVTVQKALVSHCEKMLYRFAVIDTPAAVDLNGALAWRRNFDTTRAAVYHPWCVIADRFGEPGDRLSIPPAGHMLGVIARTDVDRGVWKAPGNEIVRGILGFATMLTRGEQEILNPAHVNAYRDFRAVNRGLRIYGARTASSNPEWRYINVRRLFLFVEQSLDAGLQFAVFEPNDVALWSSVRQSVTAFLRGLWNAGGLVGATEEEAFFVGVGIDVTMDEADIAAGRMIVEIGMAPSRPAEFVILRFTQKTRDQTE